MKKKVLSFDEQLAEEQLAVNRLIVFFENNFDFSRVIYEDWSAKDVLGHIASWHLSFERNLLSVINNEKAKPFSGSLTDINEAEVKIMRQYSVRDIIDKLLNAQESINNNIRNPNVVEIPYKKGSRNYSPIEHLEVVQRHINSHLKDIIKKYEEAVVGKKVK